MRREPPDSVKKILRKEVRFGCPIPECSNPYLEWHHFDPPWAKEEHHRPEGMIALCNTHHKRADAGAFTIEQLKRYKSSHKTMGKIHGSFDWLRSELLMKSGTNFIYKTNVVLQINGHDIIWLTRDSDNYLQLNFSGIFFRMERNIWNLANDSLDISSPPGGKSLIAQHTSGEKLLIRFKNIDSWAELVAEGWIFGDDEIALPTTIVEFEYVAPLKKFTFSNFTAGELGASFHNCFLGGGNVAVSMSLRDYFIISSVDWYKTKYLWIQY